ncbi:MAG: BamA/TamA family outer membrane protein [Bacteroidaceae bacterium]|nr:BamA/TamA family outer membrane protein [Bacteroidaceae bacterium]
MKSSLLHIFLLFAVTVSSLAQSSNTKAKPTLAYSTDPTVYTLGGVSIDGINDEQEVNRLIGMAGLIVGQEITFPKADNEITKAVRNLWSQRLFSDVTITADSIVGNTIYLHIQLAAHPQLTEVNYSGIKKTEREDLEEKLKLRPGNQISVDVIDRVKYIIQTFFEDKGFKNVDIEVLQRDDPKSPNHVLLDININKNEKVKVHRIYFTGADEALQKSLKRAMKKTREVGKLRNFFSSKKFIEEKYTADKAAVVSKYNSWGYRDAFIVADSVVPFDEKHVDVYLTIDQGGKYYVRNINWVGNTVYSTDALAKTLQLKNGDIYNQELLTKRLGTDMSKADDDAIANQYYNHGYVFNRIIPVETNVVGDSVDLEIRIREGKQATLNKINIIGNEHVFEDVVRRELRTKPGDLFNKEALMRSLRDLASMGHFDPEQLTPDLKQDEADGTVDITYKLSSKSTDKLEFSMGYGAMGVTGRIAVQFNNFAIQNLFKKGNARNFFLPQGEGQSVEIAAQTNGRYYQQYSLSFMDPWFGKKRPNQLSVSLFYSKQTDVNSNYYNSAYYNNYYSRLYGYGSSSNYYNYADYYDPDKYVQILGGSIGWGKRLRWPDDYFNFSAMLTFQRYNLKQWQYFIMTDGNCNNLNLTLSLTRNSSDQPFFPRRGSDLALSVSATPPYSMWDGKDYANLANNTSSATYLQEMKQKYRWIEYHKWKFRFKTYTALTKADKCPVLMTRTEFGLLGYYHKHKPSPFETFYMGGDGMSGYSYNYATETIGLRGYDNGALTPQGMEAYAYSRLSMELRYPLLLGNTSIYALGFLEGGNAWTSCSKFNPFDLKRSAGAGLRLFLPMIGMLGIDWAYGFDKIFGSRNYSGSQFHFIIGQEF